MPYDYSEAPPPGGWDLIPADTQAVTQMRIRAGGVGEDGMLTRSQKGDCEMLDLEFVILEGEYKRRKFWQYMILEGTAQGQHDIAKSYKHLLRTILESSRGIKPSDMSQEARTARTASLREFDNIIFIAKIGIEKGKLKNNGTNETWPDKNILVGAVTPDEKNWHPVEQPPPFDGGSNSANNGAQAASSTSPAPGITKPSWAS